MSSIRAVVLVFSLLALVANAQFLNLPKELEGLVPQVVLDVLKPLNQEQLSALNEVAKDKSLGLKTAEAVLALRKKIAQLPSKIGSEQLESYYLTLSKINELKTLESRTALRNLILGYLKLPSTQKEQLSSLFPEVTHTLEQADVRVAAGLPAVQ